jgi:hypothetical protein
MTFLLNKGLEKTKTKMKFGATRFLFSVARFFSERRVIGKGSRREDLELSLPFFKKKKKKKRGWKRGKRSKRSRGLLFSFFALSPSNQSPQKRARQ